MKQNLIHQTEQIQVTKNNNKELWQYCDDQCWKSKNLYNYTNYIVRQEFINNGKWIRFYELYKLVKDSQPFKEMVDNSGQQVLKLLDINWKVFFSQIKDYNKNPSKYTGRPNLPKYKDKEKGRNLAIFRKHEIHNKFYKFTKSDIKFKTTVENWKDIVLVRIVPKASHYIIEVVYKKEIKEMNDEVKNIASIDLGLNNLITLTNNIGLPPIAINGRILKSINQYYNKKTSELQSIAKKSNKQWTTKRIQKITLKRNNKVKDQMHKVSRFIIDWCIEKEIDTLVIGKNENWKNEINIGKRNNQNFVMIPHSTLIHQLQYKGKNEGIKVIITEESYTSKSSFLDNDPLPKYKEGQKNEVVFSGKRIKRGLYKSGNSTLINADVNGSYNIGRKVFPNLYFKNNEGIKDVGLHPVKISIKTNDTIN